MRLFALLALLACKGKSPPVPAAPPRAERSTDPRSAGVEDPRLAALLDEHWDGLMQRHPGWATQLGDHRFDGESFDSSAPAEAAWYARMNDWVRRLEALDGLPADDEVTRDLLVTELRGEIGQRICDFPSWSFSARSNPMLEGNDLGQRFDLTTPQDGLALVRRMQGMASDVLMQAQRLEEGASEGKVANRISTEKVIEQVRTQLALPLEEQPVLAPLERIPSSWTPAQQDTFRTNLRSAAQLWLQAMDTWVGTLETRVLPLARTDGEGLIGVPDGLACYDELIEHYTTLPLDADELHATGLAEIDRIQAELSALGARSLAMGDVQAIFERLRTDPELYFTTELQVEGKAREALGRAKAAIPQWFGRLPEADCVVERVPPYEAPYTTIAYYRQVVPGERPGAYVVNTYAPETRPRYEAEALAFHESIPGHHLQIALAQETGDIPMFRRHLGATAFVEGWALYTEQLADEMGLYSSDLDRIGMLGFELWRASRLVVDTGLHAKGWSRQQAIDYMLANTPLAENNIVNEVDRYITTPGQALAYKTGQLEIWRLRREAEARLGDRFDIKAFHDVVLGAGAVSLPVLRKRVEGWVESQAG